MPGTDMTSITDRLCLCCRGMLKRKRHEVGDKAGKLKGGLQKLQETGVQVAEMQVSICLPSSMCLCVPCQVLL